MSTKKKLKKKLKNIRFKTMMKLTGGVYVSQGAISKHGGMYFKQVTNPSKLMKYAKKIKLVRNLSDETGAAIRLNLPDEVFSNNKKPKVSIRAVDKDYESGIRAREILLSRGYKVKDELRMDDKRLLTFIEI